MNKQHVKDPFECQIKLLVDVTCKIQNLIVFVVSQKWMK